MSCAMHCLMKMVLAMFIVSITMSASVVSGRLSKAASEPVKVVASLLLTSNPMRFQSSARAAGKIPQVAMRGRHITMQASDDNPIAQFFKGALGLLVGPKGMQIEGWKGTSLDIPEAITLSPVNPAIFNFPSEWPYSDSDFKRMDESSDSYFYSQPRFVTHIDDAYIEAIKGFYSKQFSAAPGGEYSVLDICSSWVSHYPEDLQAKRVAITGMEESELRRNSQATEFVAKDLNEDPTLPYGNDEFDFITNVVSVDYLTKPREIFAEMHRVMKPGGVAIMSFSNRCFPSKAISMWVRNMNDGKGHCQIVGNYFRFNPEGGWRAITAVDLSPYRGVTDPVWVVTAIKA